MAKNKEYTNNETHSRGSVKSEYTHTRRGYKDTKSPSIVKDTSTPVRNEILRLEETLQHISPKTDGIDHINIYSRGKTKLGKYLSNFYEDNFVCDDGKFKTIEGYWFWLQCDNKNLVETLRTTSGFTSKILGTKYRTRHWSEISDFKSKIILAMENKVAQNIYIANEMIKSTLPFTHYYYITDDEMLYLGETYDWIIQEWERIRIELKKINNLGD